MSDDIAPDFDFTAAMREAEQNALNAEAEAPVPVAETPEPVAEPEAPEPAAEVTDEPDEQPRNPDGTFAPKSPATESTADQLLAGRFKSVDELERGYQELLRLDGQKSNELGELRKAFEERMAQFEERVSQPAPLRITADLIDQNPGAAAQLAYEQRDEHALHAAFDVWKDEDPAAAASWAAARHMEQREAQLRSEFEERVAAIEQRFQPIADTNREQELALRTREVLVKHPDTTAFIENGMVGEIAAEFPDLGAALGSGDPVRTADALRAAVEIAKGRVAGNLEHTTETVQRQADEQAARARDDAYVASATQTSTPPVKTAEEEEADRFTERVRARTVVWDSGWD